MVPQKLVANRPAQILDNQEQLDLEFRAARWAYHRLLDFEDSHQAHLDSVQEVCAPGLTRIGRILSTLRRRDKRRDRSTRFVPGGHPELRRRLEAQLSGLRTQRNEDLRWKDALQWAQVPGPDTSEKSAARCKPGETFEEFAIRKAQDRRRSRREHFRVAILYPQIKCFYDSWNHLIKSCDQARAAVLKLRKSGLPSEWRRPRWDDPNTIVASKPGHYRIIERGKPWWTIEMRLHTGWVRFRAKLGNWHEIQDDAKLSELKLTRRKDGRGWSYSVSLLVDGVTKRQNHFANEGVVALDWGHREYQHSTASQGMRVFFAVGNDGSEGELLLPVECRKLKDLENLLKSRVDETFNARKATLGLSDQNRFAYRNRLRKLGVRTREEHDWLAWEVRYERRMTRCRNRIEAIRSECYTQGIRNLRKRYKTFIFEDESTRRHQQLDKAEMTRHRKRENRDMSARYEFLSICERFGAEILLVPSRNSTRECPDVTCGGLLAENGSELMVACPKCGVVRDKDRGACVVLLRRGQEALAKRNEAA